VLAQVLVLFPLPLPLPPLPLFAVPEQHSVLTTQACALLHQHRHLPWTARPQQRRTAAWPS